MVGNQAAIVFGPAVIPWLEQQLGQTFSGEAIGLGLMRGDQWVAGVAYRDRQYHNVNVSLVAMPGSLTRPFLRAIHDYPFNYLGVNRVTAHVRRSNSDSISIIERVGFRYEGCQRMGYPDGEDKLMYGILREEYKWPASR